jgi:hypothetical protein
MIMDLTTLSGARKYVETVVFNGAREIIEGGEQHRPLAFILATAVPGTPVAYPRPVYIVPFPFAALSVEYGLDFDERGKDIYAEAIQQVCKATKAVGAVFICEAWTARYDADGGVVGRPSESPDRREILAVWLDHRDGRIYCSAPIERDGDRATLGAFEWDDANADTFGRFVNLLGRPEPPEPQA